MDFNLLEKEDRPMGPNYLAYILGTVYAVIALALIIYIVTVKIGYSGLQKEENKLADKKLSLEKEVVVLDNKIDKINEEINSDPEYNNIQQLDREFNDATTKNQFDYGKFMTLLGESASIQVGIQEVKVYEGRNVEIILETTDKQYVKKFIDKLKEVKSIVNVREDIIPDKENMYKIFLEKSL